MLSKKKMSVKMFKYKYEAIIEKTKFVTISIFTIADCTFESYIFWYL